MAYDVIIDYIKYRVLYNNAIVVGFDGRVHDVDCLKIPGSINYNGQNVKVTEIRSEAFYGVKCKRLEIPETITRIGTETVDLAEHVDETEKIDGVTTHIYAVIKHPIPWFNSYIVVFLSYFCLLTGIVVPWFLFDWRWYSLILYAFVIVNVLGYTSPILAEKKEKKNWLTSSIVAWGVLASCFYCNYVLPDKWWVVCLTHILIAFVGRFLSKVIARIWGSKYTSVGI